MQQQKVKTICSFSMFLDPCPLTESVIRGQTTPSVDPSVFSVTYFGVEMLLATRFYRFPLRADLGPDHQSCDGHRTENNKCLSTFSHGLN